MNKEKIIFKLSHCRCYLIDFGLCTQEKTTSPFVNDFNKLKEIIKEIYKKMEKVNY